MNLCVYALFVWNIAIIFINLFADIVVYANELYKFQYFIGVKFMWKFV